MSAHLKQMIYRTSKDFVSNQIPEDTSFFEPIWDAFKGMLDKWSDKHPTEWPNLSDQRRLLSNLGFADQSIDLLTPYIIATISATVFHLGRLEERPRIGKIKEVLKMYSEKLGVPRGIESQIATFVSPLLQMEFSKIPFTGHKYVRPKGYMVFEGTTKPRFCLEEELEKYRKKRAKYEIYVDDIESEVLVKGKVPKLRPGQTDAYLTLLCLLESVGSYWDYEDLYHQGTRRVSHPTGMAPADSVRLYVRIRYIKKTIAEIVGAKTADKWVRTEGRRRVMIDPRTKTCLIKVSK